MTKPHLEQMSDEQIAAWIASSEFNRRWLAMRERILAGEAMSFGYIADELGLPWHVFAETFAETLTAFCEANGIAAQVEIDNAEPFLHS